MRHVALLVLVCLLCGACATGDKRGGSPSSGLGLQVFPVGQRTPAPELSGTTIAGRRLTLADRLGRGLVAVNVWASWCGPCRMEMPLLARASRSRLQVIGIDERDDAKSAGAFTTARGVSYPSLSDPDGRLLAQLTMLPQTGVPSTLILDSQGRVAARVVGPLDRHTLQAIIQRLGGSP